MSAAFIFIEGLERRLLFAALNIETQAVLGNISSFQGVGFKLLSVGRFDAFYKGSITEDLNAKDFSAYVNWGDGTGWMKVAPVLDQNPHNFPFDIKASHVYQRLGTFTPRVYVTGGGDRQDVIQFGTIAVANMPSPAARPGMQPADYFAPSKPPGRVDMGIRASMNGSFSATTGATVQEQLLGFVIGTYNSAADSSPSDYAVQINWGDSRQWIPADLSTDPAPAPFPIDVRGSHSYEQPGVYPIVAYLTGPDGTSYAQSLGTFYVGGKPSKPPANTFTLRAEVDASDTAMEIAHDLDLTTTQIENDVETGVDQFSIGLTDPEATGPRIDLQNPLRDPFGGTMFEAGRALRGIATGIGNLVKLPFDLFHTATMIAQHPEVLKTGAGLAGEAVQYGISHPEQAIKAVVGGALNGFANMDGADFGGQQIGNFIVGKVINGLGAPFRALVAKEGNFGSLPVANLGGELLYQVGEGTVGINGSPGKNLVTLLAALRDVNLGQLKATVDGFSTNCPNTSLVVARRLAVLLKGNKKFAGDPQLISALPIRKTNDPIADLVAKLAPLEKEVGGTFKLTVRPSLEQQLKQQGFGARGMIALPYKGGSRDGLEGHILNVVNLGADGIWYIDGQTQIAYQAGTSALSNMLAPYSGAWRYMPTP